MPASGTIKLELTKSDGRVFPLGVSLGTSISWIRTKPLDLGDASTRKCVQRMILDITERASLAAFTLIVSTADNFQDTFVEETAVTVDNVDKPINLRVRNARYYKFKFLDEQVSVAWKLSAFELLGTTAGMRT